MMIYTNTKRSKQRKPNAKQRELAVEWQKIVSKYKPTKALVKIEKSNILNPKPYVRETAKIPSLATFGDTCTKPIHGKVYTGSKMIGIGTLHKSNAVPIFSDDDAKDQALMRR
jgi:hypothetical protein